MARVASPHLVRYASGRVDTLYLAVDEAEYLRSCDGVESVIPQPSDAGFDLNCNEFLTDSLDSYHARLRN